MFVNTGLQDDEDSQDKIRHSERSEESRRKLSQRGLKGRGCLLYLESEF